VVTAGLAVTDAPAVAESPVDGDHVYVPPTPAPLAVNVTAGALAHLVTDGHVIVGPGVTVTVHKVVPIHPDAVVPVTVYVVVTAGLAVIGDPVVADNPVAGDQVYVPPNPAPVAVSVTGGDPAHLVAPGAVITGGGVTLT